MNRYAIALAFVLIGCGGGGGGGGDDGASNDDFAVAAHDSAGYPAGPYNHAIGSVMPPLSWIGYNVPKGDALATSAPYQAYSMDDFRRSGSTYGVVHVAEFS